MLQTRWNILAGLIARRLFIAAFLMEGLASGPALLRAQSGFEAQIRGKVTDPSGAVVSGAKVRLTDVATGIETSTTSNDSGIYTLNGLRPATYNLAIEQPGFAKTETKNIGASHAPLSERIELNTAVTVEVRFAKIRSLG